MGHEISVLSDKGDGYVERVVHYINEKAEEIGATSEDTVTSQKAILIALNIADELFSIKEEKETLCSQFENGTERLINYLELRKEKI